MTLKAEENQTVTSEFHDATYSPEDNKLRLYPKHRLDKDLYDRLRKAGFIWASKQELFVAPSWSPDREDICIELHGEVELEQSTMAERAEAKAERLQSLADKRADDASGFMNAANQLSQRFAMGQPILVGHHSERSARKDKERMESNMRKTNQAISAQNYWIGKIGGVQSNANHKNRPDVRARRIKKLLAELRDIQRGLNFHHKVVCSWEAVKKITDEAERHQKIITGVYGYYPEHSRGYRGASDDIKKLKAFNEAPGDFDEAPKHTDGEVMTFDTILERSQIAHEKALSGERVTRWISHTLGRLSYENSFMGTTRFSGKITGALLQVFVRTHGVDKPKASKTDKGWIVKSGALLPVHIGEGTELELSEDGWRDLMVSVSYEPPAAKPKAPPLLNFKAQTVTVRGYRDAMVLEQVEMTKAEFADIYENNRGVRLSECGTFRVKIHNAKGGGMLNYKAVFLTDSKEHPAPESKSIALHPSE